MMYYIHCPRLANRAISRAKSYIIYTRSVRSLMKFNETQCRSVAIRGGRVESIREVDVEVEKNSAISPPYLTLIYILYI